LSVETVTRASSKEAVRLSVANADAIIHLAGVNRPETPADFEIENVDFTRSLCQYAIEGRQPRIVFASSIHAEADTAYGNSKRRAEDVLRTYASQGGASLIFRLPNVFGPGARPNYNSMVATFAFNAANDLPLTVRDPAAAVSLAYIQDVVSAMTNAATRPSGAEPLKYEAVQPVTDTKVGKIAELMGKFQAIRRDLRLPDLSDIFVRQLYATFVSHIPMERLAYELPVRNDNRGSLAEMLKSPSSGQIFVSRTQPGITRGNHFHHTKTEKFLVMYGSAVVRFRKANDASEHVIEYPVEGAEFRVIDIPPGYTHSIQNTGTDELVVLFWASEIFDPLHPDTFPLNVI
jgi:UDP-2-acetamido-2,6-beta-L-arabino-hexul-4-ose reductase